MLYKYFTEKLLVLQDVDIEKVEEIDNSIHINCRLKRKPHKCPCCGKLTDKVHDYREQPIKDIPAFLFILISADIVAPVASGFVIVFYICFLTNLKNGSIINVGVTNRSYKNNFKKVEHICLKSVKMELTRNQKRWNKYALQIFYRKTFRIARC